jgi:hypothetical protein
MAPILPAFPSAADKTRGAAIVIRAAGRVVTALIESSEG